MRNKEVIFAKKNSRSQHTLIIKILNGGLSENE